MFTTVLRFFFFPIFFLHILLTRIRNRLSTRTPCTTTLTDRCRGLGNTKLLQRTNAMISNGHIFPVEMEGCLIAGAKVCAVVETYEEYFDDTAHVKKPNSLQCRLFWLGSHFHLATCVKRDGKPRTRASDRSLSHRNMLTLPVSIICVKYLLHSSGKKRVHFIQQVEKLG